MKKILHGRSNRNKVSPSEKKSPRAELCVLEMDIPASLSDVTTTVSSPSRSLGFGSFNTSGQVESFSPSPTKKQQQHQHQQQKQHGQTSEGTGANRCTLNESAKQLLLNDEAERAMIPHQKSSSMTLLERIEKVSPVVFKRALSSFIRVADLNMAESVHTVSDTNSEESFPNFHCVSIDPPPGVNEDPNELWVCLDNGDGGHAPIAPLAIRALARSGLSSAFDQSMWNPELKTARLVKMPEHAWHECTWIKDRPAQLPPPETRNDGTEREVLVWSGNFTHGRYGSELPAVRSAALINMAPEALMDLLVDSNRVKEYNKMSLGRKDLLVLQDELDGGAFGGITKVMRSETRPPMVRKTLSFTSILYVRRLADDAGFKLVSRAVTSPVDSGLAGTLQSEILLSVNIIKRVEGDPNQCLLICLNHIRSPMVPMMIAKRIGLTAAVGFINDLRACA